MYLFSYIDYFRCSSLCSILLFLFFHLCKINMQVSSFNFSSLQNYLQPWIVQEESKSFWWFVLVTKISIIYLYFFVFIDFWSVFRSVFYKRILSYKNLINMILRLIKSIRNFWGNQEWSIRSCLSEYCCVFIQIVLCIFRVTFSAFFSNLLFKM